MLKFITKAISSALGFSKVEARGTLLLTFIMLTFIISSQVYIHQLKSTPYVVDNELKEWVQTLEASIKVKEQSDSYDKSVYLPAKKKKFTKKPLPKQKIFERKSSSPKAEPIVVKDLNSASADELQVVKGIGPAFSKRIIKYREMLGGFATTDQLSEVYGLKEETIFSLTKHFEIQSGVVSINLNTDSAKVLARHPYISYDIAWVIINYRKQNGDIHSMEDLKKIKAIDDELLSRLTPYLD